MRVVIVGEVLNELSVWPNPSNRLDLTISRGSRGLKLNSVNLINLGGSTTKTISNPIPVSESSYQLHLPDDLPAGMYILQIRYEGGVEAHKISITH